MDTAELRALADCDARAGEPLGRALRAAADEIERLRRTVANVSEAWTRFVEDDDVDAMASAISTARQAVDAPVAAS